jgi:hypothetical protein
MVDSETADRVAAQEKQAYQDALTGICGAAEKEKAEKLGLGGIVEACKEERRDRTDGWAVHDLITDEWSWRPGAGGRAVPDCHYDADHEPNPETLMLRLVAGNHADKIDGDNAAVEITIRCKLCGRMATTKGLNFFWPEHE